MTRSAIEALADLAQPRAYWIELLTRAGERGLEMQSSEPGDLRSARQRCRYMMEGALYGRHPRMLPVKKTIDKLVSKLVADYRRTFSEEISAYNAHRNGERACTRSACVQCRPHKGERWWVDWRVQREKRRAEIRKERRKRRKQKKQRARAKKSRRKNR